ncbi:hypothetical protein QAD02_005088 [Eretmocerus hayati]|uniref:Uncharacterized protein n=1 Tax=Eretmocerus hayati TaxID=131215 RepID=A0ACC2NTB5_9HYME|nr:hypothetical protein QAD02_005088 [Eretmocerus hayati]
MEKLFVFSIVLRLLLITDQDVRALIGGDPAQLNDYPFNAVLKRDSHYVCSGSIINKKHVVSAAHCVINITNMEFEDKPTYVTVGTNHLHSSSSGGLTVAVEKIFIPSEYFKKIEPYTEVGDICVLQLRKRIDFSLGNVRLKNLKLPGNGPYVDGRAIITGFGWDWIDYAEDEKKNRIIKAGGSSGILRAAEARVLPKFDCQCKGCRPFDTDRHLCARISNPSLTDRKATCFGDSGAPLVYGGDTLIGVLSSGSPVCDETEMSGAYTKVAYYIDFIVKSMLDVEDPIIRVFKPSSHSDITSNDVLPTVT